MDKKLFIFDLDGTLVNTVVDLNNGINYALNKNGYPSKSVDHTAHAIGNGIFITILRSLPTKDEEAARICLKDFREFYRNHFLDHSFAYPGMKETLRKIKNSGALLAVATNKLDEIAKKMINTLYPGVFDMIQGDLPNLPKKPDPAIINYIIKELGVDKEKTTYIGDSEVDILSAKNAGVDLVLVDYGFHHTDEFLNNNNGPHISEPSELLKFLS